MSIRHARYWGLLKEVLLLLSHKQEGWKDSACIVSVFRTER